MRRWLLLLLIPGLLAAQVAQKANEGYRTEEGRANVGKGLAGPNRDAQQKPEQLVRSLGIKPGMSVADVGTGVGYMLPFLSKAVGPGGHVYAEDIFPDFLDKAKQRGAESKLENVTFILGDTHSPKLPPGKLDLVLILDAYHHFDYPSDMLADIKRALAPGGRLAIVEYYKTKDSMGGGRALEHIRFTDTELVKELESYGFHKVSVQPHVPNVQYLAIFRPR